MTTENAVETTEASNVVEMPKPLTLETILARTDVTFEGRIELIVNFYEARLTKIEKQQKNHHEVLAGILANHETFMQGLEDACKELMKNDLIRVTIPAQFREKITQYIATRENQRAAQSAQPKPAEGKTDVPKA